MKGIFTKDPGSKIALLLGMRRRKGLLAVAIPGFFWAAFCGAEETVDFLRIKIAKNSSNISIKHRDFQLDIGQGKRLGLKLEDPSDLPLRLNLAHKEGAIQGIFVGNVKIDWREIDSKRGVGVFPTGPRGISWVISKLTKGESLLTLKLEGRTPSEGFNLTPDPERGGGKVNLSYLKDATAKPDPLRGEIYFEVRFDSMAREWKVYPSKQNPSSEGSLMPIRSLILIPSQKTLFHAWPAGIDRVEVRPETKAISHVIDSYGQSEPRVEVIRAGGWDKP